jgi:uncharacterized membrane protein
MPSDRMRRHLSPFGEDAFGRQAEAAARLFGTPQYILGQTLVVIAWIALNALAVVRHWDPYPFILLNLAFSTQAAYAAPMILLAQNRQADRDRIETERDRETNARQLAEAEFLAREIAGLRHLLEQKADRDDVVGALRELTGLLDRRLDADPAAERREPAGGTSLDQPGG